MSPKQLVHLKNPTLNNSLFFYTLQLLIFTAKNIRDDKLYNY